MRGQRVPGPLRVAVVTESFLPSRNGVTTSVCQVLEHLARCGHDAVVICPGPSPAGYQGFDVVAVPAISYRGFPVGLPTAVVQRTLAGFGPDVVHVASPFVLGAAGLAAARRMDVPSVAVFQTDVAGFARRHHAGAAAGGVWRWIRRIHAQADLTLAPSSAALRDLVAHGITRVALWGRGVDTGLFSARRRAGPEVAALRRRLAPDGEIVVGYVGRLALEKRVERLACLTRMDGVRLAVVGDGPARPSVARALAPLGATLLGELGGEALADAYACLDVFVHTGTAETFGQTLQEAMATGVPVVAPAAGGPLDLVRDGVTGLLYPPEDDAALRRAVARLARDPPLRERMGRAGLAEVTPRTWQALGDQLLAHYAAAIRAHHGSVPLPA